MAYTAAQQGGLYRARKRRLGRVLLQGLTQWTPGLTVAEGEYVSANNQTQCWLATSSGVTGATQPSGQGAFDDGGVSWVISNIQSLLQYQFAGVPTP
jgi:hypothetical protein